MDTWTPSQINRLFIDLQSIFETSWKPKDFKSSAPNKSKNDDSFTWFLLGFLNNKKNPLFKAERKDIKYFPWNTQLGIWDQVSKYVAQIAFYSTKEIVQPWIVLLFFASSCLLSFPYLVTSFICTNEFVAKELGIP